MTDLLNKLVENWQQGWQIVAYLVAFALGVFCLVKFCDIFVESASVIAKKLKISPLIIGLTIVAMGTSLPELSVSLADSINKIGTGQNTAIALGNAIGSNICNVLLVLGMSVVFTPIVIKDSVKKREMPIFLGVSLILTLFICFFANDGVVGQPTITRWEGIVLLILFVSYIAFMIVMGKKHPEEVEDVVIEKDMSWAKAIILTVLGCAGIILGGQLVVFGAENLAVDSATALGVDKDLATTLVGLTVVAVGTSLPELVTSVVAAKKGENDIALGNVIGSNIFNALFILGTSAVVNPLGEGATAYVDVAVMMAVAVLLFLFSLKGKLGKAQGFVMLGVYLAYVTYLIIRTV